MEALAVDSENGFVYVSNQESTDVFRIHVLESGSGMDVGSWTVCKDELSLGKSDVVTAQALCVNRTGRVHFGVYCEPPRLSALSGWKWTIFW